MCFGFQASWLNVYTFTVTCLGLFCLCPDFWIKFLNKIPLEMQIRRGPFLGCSGAELHEVSAWFY